MSSVRLCPLNVLHSSSVMYTFCDFSFGFALKVEMIVCASKHQCLLYRFSKNGSIEKYISASIMWLFTCECRQGLMLKVFKLPIMRCYKSIVITNSKNLTITIM